MPEREYILCTFVLDQSVGETFTQWPLHITLVTWFTVDNISTVQERLIEALEGVNPIEVMVSEEKVWGVHTVNVIERSTLLDSLHKLLIAAVRDNGKIIINEQYMDEHYTPHITQQKIERVHPGEKISMKNVYVIEKNNNLRLKSVLYKIPFM